LLSALTLVVLLVMLSRDGIPMLSSEFFSSFGSRLPERSGIRAALWGTIWVIGLTIVIAVPIGVSAAVYLEEFDDRKSRFTDFIKLNIANLAGVPSIVYGLLGLALFVRWLALDRSILAGALTMSLLILPVIILVSQEALRAVPSSLREASLALGATRWQTIRRQVLRNALPGILTGIILSVSRAVGETAPLIAIGAVTFIMATPGGVMDKFTVLPIQIFDWTARPQPGFQQVAAGAIVVLLGVLLAFNLLAILIRQYQRRALGR
jgi:phosphate transport system permease protein